MRPIYLLLAIPLIAIAVVQVISVPEPIVAVDLVAAVVVAWAAAALARPLARPLVTARRLDDSTSSGLERREWLILYGAWFVALAVTVVAVKTPLQWAMCCTWATAMLAAVLMSRAESRRVAVASVVTAMFTVATPIGTTLQEWLSSALAFLALVVPVLAVGLLVRNQRRSAAVQREAARDRERRAMAEELHDVIAHEVTGIIVLAQAVGPSAAGTPAGAAIERIEASGQRALDQIRSMIATARTADGGEPPVYAPGVASLSDLRAIVDNFADSVPADVRLVMRGEDTAVSPQVAMAASRILTEALTNVRRHALTATEVDVEVSVTDGIGGAGDGGAVRVEVSDDGFGGGLGAGNGTGVAGITERAALLGGTAQAGRAADGRWRVRATIPLVTVDVTEDSGAAGAADAVVVTRAGGTS